MKEGSIDIYCSKDQLGWVVAVAANVLGGVDVSYVEGSGWVVGADCIPLYESHEGTFLRMYEQLVDKIEEYVKEHRVGLPWYAEILGDPDEGASLFLSESLEVGCYIRNEDGSGCGASWTPYDLWDELEPPPPITELLKEE